MIWQRKTGWIGIELGIHASKVAQLERRSGSWRMTRAIVPRGFAGASVDAANGGVQSARLLGEEIRAVIDGHPNFRGRQAAVVLPMLLTDLRPVKLPATVPGELEMMLSHELANMYGEESSNRTFDFWETEGPAEQGQFQSENVNLLSADNADLDEVLRCLGTAGLLCEVIDGLPWALARAVSLTSPGHAQPIAIAALDWGFSSSTICILWNDRPVFTRTLRDCGLGDLLSAVGQAANLTPEEVREIVMSHGLPHPNKRESDLATVQEMIAEGAAAQLNRITNELERTLAYLRVQRPLLLPARCFLFGDGSAIRNAAVNLSAKTSISVETWKMPLVEEPDGPSPHPLPMFGTSAALSALAFET